MCLRDVRIAQQKMSFQIKYVLILPEVSVLLQTLLEVLREFYCCTLEWQLSLLAEPSVT